MSEASEEETFPADVDLALIPGALRLGARAGLAFCAEPVPRPPEPERVRLPIASPPPLPPGELRESPDKYTLSNLPDIDCADRLPLCKARCCHFTFALSRQDVEEGVVRWDPAAPYRILRRADKSCSHLDAGGCSIYPERPAVCRSYDCRSDTRVWIDFARRIPARAR